MTNNKTFKKAKAMKDRISNRGFTVVELLVATALSGIVMASIYSTYYLQQKSYIVQEQVVHMQQNIRAAMYFIEREIRMAGYNPKGVPGIGIQDMGWNASENRYTSIRITMDMTDDTGTGDPDGDVSDANEDIIYSLSDIDADNDNDLVRNDVNDAGNLEVSNNIDALD
ncbi:MAG: prepilin-type N-terminal cleavage/methylation domain-containing protein, partial [Thermodesulfobacteriota bacterium]|nr:prepilin-type N-terminal cleavage/methylation domain-containing protein [Thermodesulfobacteriota bacterium]